MDYDPVKQALNDLDNLFTRVNRELDAIGGNIRIDLLSHYAFDYGVARNLGATDAEAHAYATARNGGHAFAYFGKDGIELGILKEG